MRLSIRLALIVCLVLAACPALAGDRDVPFGRAIVHFTDQGPSRAVSPAPTPMVFVPGWSCDTSFWSGQVGPFSARRRVLAVDLPGTGRSTAPETGYGQDDLADAVVAVLDFAGIERAVFVGHSMGASVIRRIAVRHPERVAGLVLVDGALMFLPEDPAGLPQWQAMMDGFVAGFSGPDAQAHEDAFFESLFGEDTPAELRAEVRRKMTSAPEHARLATMAGMADPEVWRGGPVRQPTLALFVVSPDMPPDTERTMRREFTDLEYVLWNGPGHFVQLERPDEVNVLIEDWLVRRGL